MAATTSHAGCEENAVSILLAAKFQESEWVAAASRAGGSPMGYNYIQQLEEGERALTGPGVPFHRVHVIGHVQVNKAGKAIRVANCIETVDSPKFAVCSDRSQGERASAGELRKDGSPLNPFDAMIQANPVGPGSQHGVDPSGVVDFTDAITDLSNLRLVGFMLIGTNTDDVAAIAASHARTRKLRDAVQTAGVASCAELPMGMTGDTGIVITEDLMEVRISTVVLGPRPIMKQNHSR